MFLGGLAVLILLRGFERLVYKTHRPLTAWLPVIACRLSLPVLGLRPQVTGSLAHQTAAVVANHSSWLDIFVLNSLGPLYFVSKSEVASWPGIGWLARAAGTVFIARNRNQAAAQRDVLSARFAAGDRLLFFPEGTSSDGQRVLPFKSTLFAALFDPGLSRAYVQPVSLFYHPRRGTDPRALGWWGDMEFGSHFFQVLAFGTGARVTVTCHDPVATTDALSRKDLAQKCEVLVKASHAAAIATTQTR